jgi:TolB-like protein/DNA-binding winged helix-turn-helix (wHTH) protein/tetratricopeptide (TPR) repeat protein
MAGSLSEFRLNGYSVRPASGEVQGRSGWVRIEPKAMAVLSMLAQARGEVVSRDALLQQVWPRGFVTDDVLTRCISQLRRALGDAASAPAFLETIPRRGYRLVCEIESGADDVLGMPGAPDATLMVMPFQDLTAGHESHLADGLTEILIARLSSLRDIRVISRTTAMKYRQSLLGIPAIASQVGATWIVEGSVLGAANRVQVVAQLIEARTDGHLWAESYIRDLSDLLVIQNDIAQRVATSIRHTLAPDDPLETPPVKLTAAQLRLYLRARHLISQRTPGALREALAVIQDLAGATPDYPPLWSSLAESQFMLMHYGEEPVDIMLISCRESLNRALALSPEDPQALGLTGILELMFDWQPEQAIHTLSRALARRPSFTIAMVGLANAYAVTRRFAEAEAWMRHAIETDPLDVGLNMNLGDHLILQERFAEAVEALRRVEELAPGHRPSLLRRAWAEALAGQAAAARETLERARGNDAPDARWCEYAAIVHGAIGDRVAAASALASLEALASGARLTAWSRARACAAAEQPGRAIEWLRRAIVARESSVPFAAITPAFGALRQKPEFNTLLNDLRLVT